MSRILALDPGARHCGWIIRTGRTLDAHGTITNPGPLTPIHGPYLTTIADLIEQYAPEVDHVAVEDVVAPKGFNHGQRAPINPESLIGTAAVLGVILTTARMAGFDVHRIRPGGNGAGCLATYPEALITTAERRGNWKARVAGKGARCHERSSWDISLRVVA
jgi:hypothetical protein